MHSISSTFDRKVLPSLRCATELQGDQQTPRLYSVDSCINCGHQYEYGKLKYELGGDAKMLWKRFSSVVTDHYYSCPKKFANIHQPTSAIRGTLSESHEGRSMGFKKTKTAPQYSPYSRISSRHDRSRMEVGSSRLNYRQSASPEPPLTTARHKSPPPRLESSTITAEQRCVPGTKLTTRRSDRVPDEAHPSSKDMEDSQLLQYLRQHTPHSTCQAAANNEPALSSFPSPSVLPPVWNRKRKLAQIQEVVNVDSCAPLDDIVNTRPLSPPPISVERHASPIVASAVEDRESWTPSSVGEELEEKQNKKEKKNIMDWRLRRKYLMQDPLLCAVEAKRVCCRCCNKWIKLDARNDFYPGLWLKHRRTMHGASNANSPYSDSGRRRRPKPDSEELGTRRRASGGGRNCHDDSRVSYRGALPTSTRPSRSSLRITRSCSDSSA